MMIENVKIPLSLFYQTISLLDNIRRSGCARSIVPEYESVLTAFLKKKQSLDLRDSYAKIISAQDEDQRWEASMNYLYDKRKYLNG